MLASRVKEWLSDGRGCLGVGDDISGMAVFLATDDSDYCVGGIYMVDGGLTAI
jgi:hypothetical protein